MENQLYIHNSLSRKKELFQPINPPFVGMYVCGPTVYGDPHLGHARPAITFDLVFRYLKHLGYKVRYVRNITDVGHLVADQDDGEDKIARKAAVEKLEPMEVAQYYADRYFVYMDLLNVKRPSIEPRASGHMIEQIQLVQQILDAGFAYIVNGSVYFDVEKYHQKYNYGRLSGRVLEDQMANTRELEGQEEKRNSFDFALWKKAQPEHIMRWPSPWSDGFPGWHLECSAMGIKYLGERFDIHGGGMDLIFPHHESEIAQCQAAVGHETVRYWVHNNMVTIDGQKMGKSLGNFITLDEFFTGKHRLLLQPYSPMTIRFFILQAHYRSTVDFSNEALQAAEKGLRKLMESYKRLLRLMADRKITVDEKAEENWLDETDKASPEIKTLVEQCYQAMNDDFNSAILISKLFEAVRIINSETQSSSVLRDMDLLILRNIYHYFVFDILGLKEDQSGNGNAVLDGLMDLILSIRQKSRENKDWGTSDQIRNTLQNLNIAVKDGKDGSTWEIG